MVDTWQRGGDCWWVMWEIDKVKDGERTVWVMSKMGEEHSRR